MEQVEMSQDSQANVVQSGDGFPQETIFEVKEVEVVGKYTGQCKWFNDKLGYGFVTICDGDEKGKDIFVHHTGVKPLNSNYKTLRKGEYIRFNVVDGMNGLQAIDVRGIGGGPLMCDFVSTKKILGGIPLSPHGQPLYPVKSAVPMGHPVGQWQTVSKKPRVNPRSARTDRHADERTTGKRSYVQALVE